MSSKYARANIPKRYWDLSKFDNIPDKLSFKSEIKSYIDQADYYIDNGVGIILTGEMVNINSLLASYAAMNILDIGKKVYFVNSYDVPEIQRKRVEFEEGTLLWDRMCGKFGVDLLVIDDIGSEEGNDKLFEKLVRSRYDWQRSTIFTSANIELIKAKFPPHLFKIMVPRKGVVPPSNILINTDKV